MNLYWVAEKDAEWGVFVFSQSRNRARYMLPKFEEGIEYITTKANLIGKTEEVGQETVIDDKDHSLYPVVLKLGGRFTDLEGEEGN